MADRRSIEVYGLPSFLSDDDYIRDRLLLHFLRPKNGGGDVDVHYPTEEEGAALLVFEDEKVAERILSRRHNLIIEDYVYPLEVRRPQPRESMFSGPVRTSLVLSYFSNFREVTKLLEQHGLRIYHYNDSVLGIEGDFTDLKRCHLDLNRILCRQNPVEKHNSLESTASNRSPSEGRRASDSVSTVPELKLPLLSHLSRRPPKEGEHIRQDRRPPKGDHMTQDRRPPKEGEHIGQDRRPPKGDHMTQDRRPSEGDHMTQDRRPPKGDHMTQDRRPPKERDMTQDNITRDNLSPTQRSSTNQGAQKSSTKPARSSTPTRFQNVPSPPGLFQSFLVDPAVHTYVRTFGQETINNFIRNNNIDMTYKYSDGFISITLTSLTPAQPERFDKTCLLLKELFDHYQNRLREENITLPTDPRIPNEEMTRKIQRYLLDLRICSLPVDDNTLSIMGPSNKVLMFMQDWKETRGQLVQNIIGEAAGSVSSPSPTVGMDKKDLATNSKNSTQHMVQDRRPPKEGEHMREDRRPPKEGEDMTQDRRPPKDGEHMTEDRRPPKEEDMTQDRRPPKEEHMAQDNITRDNFSHTQRSFTNQGAQMSSTKPARSSTPTRFQNIPSPQALFQSFLVDPAVHTYVRIFVQEKIDRFLRQYNINMTYKYSDCFISITLTSLIQAQPEDFDKTCSILKEFFVRYQNHLREETITLPTDPRIPNEEMTKKIQRYLLKHDIYSLPKDDNTLSIIGPSENVLMFMQDWKGTRGQLVHNMIGEAAGSVSSPSPTVGLDNNDLATKSKNSTQHMAQDRRPPKEGEHMREDRRPPKEGEHMAQGRRPPKDGEHIEDRRPPKEGEHMTQDRRPPKEGEHMTQDRRPPKEGEHMTQDRRPPKEGEDMTQERRPPKEREDMTQERRPPKEREDMTQERRPPKEDHMTQDNITRDNISHTQCSFTNQGAQMSSTKPARSSTPTRFQNVPSPRALSQSFLVDPAVHKYVRIFVQEKIDRFLRQYNINMKDKDSDGFISITLTPLTPVQPERFDKTCSILKEFFVRYQNCLREENITLPTDPRIPNEEMTRKIQLYLLKHDIYSLPMDDNTLSIIGPSENVLMFMQDWKGTRGQLVHNLIGETAGSVSSPSPTVGMDKKDLATKSKNSTKPTASDGRARGRQGRQEAHDRGRDRQQGGPSSSRGKSPARHTREPWR